MVIEFPWGNSKAAVVLQDMPSGGRKSSSKYMNSHKTELFTQIIVQVLVQDNAGLSGTCSIAEHPLECRERWKVYPAEIRNNSLFVCKTLISSSYKREHKWLINQILSFWHLIAIWVSLNPALPKSKYKDVEKDAEEYWLKLWPICYLIFWGKLICFQISN